MPFSILHSVASDGIPFLNMPILRSLPRLCLPNSIISARPTHLEDRPSTISRMMSLRRWRIFPLANLRKSGTDCYRLAVGCRLKSKFVCSYSLHLFTHTEISYVVMAKSYIFDEACTSSMLRTLATDAEIYLIGIFIAVQTHHMPFFFI